MQAGSITFSTALDNRQLEKQLAGLTKKIEKTDRKIADIRDKLNEVKEKSLFDAAVLDAEKAKLQEIKDRLADIRMMAKDKTIDLETRESYSAQIPEVQQQLADQRSQVSALQREWDRTEDAVDRYTALLAEAEPELDRQKEETGALQRQIAEAEQSRREALASAQVSDGRIVALNRELLELKQRQAHLDAAGMGTGYREYDQIAARIAEINKELKAYESNLASVEERTQKAAGHMGTFGKRLKGLMASALIFNILSAGLRAFTSWVGKAVKSNDEARQAIARLKGALLTLVQPLVEVVIPAFTMLVNILARVVTAVAQFVSALFGKSLQQSKEGAEALYEEVSALESVGAAADEASGSLAGFDEINTIGGENASGAGGNLSGDAIKPDFTGMIEGELNKIAALVGTALLAVGAILTFSGANIPLGIALMAAGALTLVSVIYENWGAIQELLQGPIGAVTAIVSAALLALGALLAFSGANIPLGIALMALGALGLVTAAAVNWDALSEVLQGPIGTVTAIVSGALLALGALLAFSGVNIPLGIFLMALGAIGLATVAAVNWDALSEVLQGPIGIITAVVSGALLVLGALLAFSNVSVPLGIALMAAGAIGLVTTAAVNWEALSTVLRGPIGRLTAVVGAALLAVGALLAFSSVNIPLGIALMAAGAVGLATAAAANWNAISEALQGPIGDVVSAVSVASLALGAVLAFSGTNIPLGLALLAAGAVGLAATVAVNWDSMRQALEGPTGAVTALISAALLALGAVILFSGANIPLGLGLLVGGAAGLAASLAANWETIQTALRGPVGTITALVGAALLALGGVLLFSGAAIPLGLGLLAAGAVGLAVSLAANWDTIVTQLGGTIETVTTIVSGALLVLGIILLFTGAAAPLGLGLVAAGAIGLATAIVPNWDFVLDAVKGAWADLSSWWDNSAAKFFTFEYWADLGKWMIDGLLDGLHGIFKGLAGWASDVWSTITGAFSTNNAKASVSSSRYGMTRAIPYTVPDISAYSVPALAQGAVIPPNREFLAVLGDQKSGNNLEMPESLLRKVLRDEMGSGSDVLALLQAILEAVRAGHIIMVDRRVLGQTVTQEQNRMTRQSGRSVVLG